MSQDLFAAFGEVSTDTSASHIARDDKDVLSAVLERENDTQHIWAAQRTSEPSSFHVHDSKVNGLQVDDYDDDDFGDFENASVNTNTAAAVERSQRPAQVEAKSDAEISAQRVHASSKTNTQLDQLKASAREEADSWPRVVAPNPQAVSQHPFAGRMDLLFDAGEDEYDAGDDELGDLATNPEAAMAYSKRIIAEQQATEGSTQVSRPAVPADVPKDRPRNTKPTGSDRLEEHSTAMTAKDPNVLFDADNLSDEAEADDDDDFGEFATFEPGVNANNQKGSNRASTAELSEPPMPPMPPMDLLGLDDTQISPKIDGAIQSVATARSTMTSSRMTGIKSTRTSQRRPEGPEPEDDAWDDFDSAAPSPSNAYISKAGPQSPLVTSKSKSYSKSSTEEPNAVPPTNVPPPVIILSLFPAMFAAADDALFNAIGKLDIKQRQMLLGHPASHQFLKGYLGHCTALPHIIAGRKLRWKRDQHLAQSMRIGPAAAGGKGGMKLAGVDKSEVAKEDREVVDTLRLWRNQVGKLRTAVTAVSSIPGTPKLPPVPDIAEQMPIKSLKPAEGGITAPHACALCGLKREERVSKVDVEIDDSFGEWWVQGTSMHVSCSNFWSEFERKLKSR